MKYQINDRVRFRYTGDYAQILKDNLDGSYMVWLEADKMESVAFVEDIIAAHLYKAGDKTMFMQQHEKKEKLPSTEELFFSRQELENQKKTAFSQPVVQPQKTVQQPATVQNNPITTPQQKKPKNIFNPKPATNSGLFIGFYADYEQHFTIYLLNDTLNSVNFSFKLFLHNYLEQSLKYIIPPHQFYPIGEINQAQFNDSPVVQFEVKSLNFFNEIKLKYKSFIKTLAETPLVAGQMYLYKMFAADYNPNQKAVSLQEYTNQNVDINEIVKPKTTAINEIELKANFPLVLDLHIEQLVPNYRELNATVTSFIGLQIKALDEYVLKASKLGVEKVVVIHGVGDGKLKEAIATRLRTHPLVKSFVNGFNELYGFGATEIELR